MTKAKKTPKAEDGSLSAIPAGHVDITIEEPKHEEESAKQETVAHETRQEVLTPSLAEYIAMWSERAEERSLTLVAVKHPAAAEGGLFAGKYSGVRLHNASTPEAQMSNGDWFK